MLFRNITSHCVDLECEIVCDSILCVCQACERHVGGTTKWGREAYLLNISHG